MLPLEVTAQQSVRVRLNTGTGSNKVSLSWSCMQENYYEIQTSTNLVDGLWNTATGHLKRSTNSVDCADLPINRSSAYYRVVDVGTNRNDLVFIPAGNFLMGDDSSASEPDERPVHEVYISGFYMAKYEVTKALWDEVYIWASEHGYDFDNPGEAKAINHPVVSVMWYDIFKWCNARSEREGLQPCYTIEDSVYRTGQHEPACDWSAYGYRLPTEAEWEKACRGGVEGERFPWEGQSITHANANYCGDDWFTWYNKSRGYHPVFNDGITPYTNPVDYFEPNEYGLYDMVGNVWDACWDWYDEGYYTNSPSSDPRGPASGTYRVERGNGWLGWGKNSRCARRAGVTPLGVRDHRGFRVCLRATE